MRALSRLFLAVNNVVPVIEPEVIRQHFKIRVNKADIRRESYNGRDHIVVSSFTLPDDVVMNGGLYTKAEIEANYKTLEGTFAPLGHPTVNGQYISATAPEAVNSFHVGAWNRNVQRVGNRIKLEKWIDVNYAQQTEKGRRLLQALEGDEPIHTSVAAFVQREPTPNAQGYTWKARIAEFDHDAILLDEPGAATPEQGVGIGVNSLVVNVADAVPLAANNVLKNSYGDRRSLLEEAARAQFSNADSFAWVQDFDDTTAIIYTGDGTKAVGYTITAGKVTWATDSTPVHSQQTWEVTAVVNKVLKTLGFGVNSEASSTKPAEEAAKMTPEEIKAMLKEQADAFAANVSAAIKPITDRLDAVERVTTVVNEQLQANANAALADKREVVAKALGEVVANALSGAALDEAYNKCRSGAPIVNASTGATGSDANQAPDPEKYLSK